MPPYGVGDAKHEKRSGGAKDTKCQTPAGGAHDATRGMPRWGTQAAEHKTPPRTVRDIRRDKLPEATGEAASKTPLGVFRNAVYETHPAAH